MTEILSAMKTKWVCTVCGYVYDGEKAPDNCPVCGVSQDKFKKENEEEVMCFADEHCLGVAKGVDSEIVDGLKSHLAGECSEVGMYLAMSRQADREGFPEVAEAYKRIAWEEAEHAAKFAELLGETIWNTKENLKRRMRAEQNACADKKRIAILAKEHNEDAIHDAVHEMAKDEARHGHVFEGLYSRYFR